MEFADGFCNTFSGGCVVSMKRKFMGQPYVKLLFNQYGMPIHIIFIGVNSEKLRGRIIPKYLYPNFQ